jgi:transcriptional regulator
MKGIVGLEMPIAGIEGKWKASQNQAPEDREGVSRGLKSETGDAATTLSKLVSRYDETN